MASILLPLVVAPGTVPTITSATSATFVVGQADSFTVTTTGVPTPTLAQGGDSLPSGVSFTDNTDGTGTLSGPAASGTGRTYNLTFTATNGIHVINQSTGTVSIDVGNSGVANSGGTFTDNTIGVNINGNDSGATNFNVLNAVFTVPSFPGLYGAGGASSQININLGGAAVPAERDTMTGNVVGNSINMNSSPTGPAVRVVANGTDNTGGNDITIKFDSNNVTGGENFDVHLLTRNGNAGINATITNNVVTTNDGPLIPGNGADSAIRIDAGATSTAAGTGLPDSGFINLDLSGNNAETPDATGLFDVRIRQRFNTTFRLEDYAGAAGDDTAVANYLAARNLLTTGGNTFTADHAATGSAGFLNIVDVTEPPAP